MTKTVCNYDSLMENCRMLKAVLRAPILSKKYQDLIREKDMGDYETLEYVYTKHFSEVGQEIKDDNDIERY
jgi:hypothetical protein